MEAELTKNMELSALHGAGCDELAKQILANREILAWLMKECLAEYRDCTVKEIAERYIEKEPEISHIPVNPDRTNRVGEMIAGLSNEDKLESEGAVYYDIRFFASAPGVDGEIKLIINVEAQNNYYPGYHLTRRGIYYCARMLSAQQGREFSGGEYDNLKKVYSIWICTQPPKQRRNTITQYEMTEHCRVGASREAQQHYDLLSVIIVNLSNDVTEDAPKGILDLMDTVFSSEIDAERKMKKMQEKYGLTMTGELKEGVSLMCNVSQGYLRYGLEKGIAQGMERGMAQGMERGMAQGMERGKMIGAIKMGRKFGLSDSQIANALVEEFAVSGEEASRFVADFDTQKWQELHEMPDAGEEENV